MRTVILFAVLAMLSACAGAPPATTPPPQTTTDVTRYLGGNVTYRETDDKVWLILSEEITEETDDVVLSALFEHPRIDLIVLENNYGGYVNPALAIGRKIRQHGIETAAEGDCASACVDIFVAGVARYAAQGAEFGLHSPSEISPEYMALDRAYYTAMGVPQMWELTYSVPYEDMVWYTVETAFSWGLVDYTY